MHREPGDGGALSHTMMPVAVPGSETVDAFSPPRPTPLQVVDPADPRNVGPVVMAGPRADADGEQHGGYFEIRADHQRALLRASGVAAGVLGIRCYRPFPAAELGARLAGRELAVVFDKAMSYGYEGPICGDLKTALFGRDGAPQVHGIVCGLGGRDIFVGELVAAARSAMDGA